MTKRWEKVWGDAWSAHRLRVDPQVRLPVTEGKAVGVPQTPPSLAEPLPHKPLGTLLLASWVWGASGRRPAAPLMTTAANASHSKPGLAGSKMRGPNQGGSEAGNK